MTTDIPGPSTGARTSSPSSTWATTGAAAAAVRRRAGQWVSAPAGYVVQTHNTPAGVRRHCRRAMALRRVPGGQHRRLVPLRAGRLMHTLVVPEDNEGVTDVWFAICGANLTSTPTAGVTSVIDAEVVRDFYLAACGGAPRPAVIGL